MSLPIDEHVNAVKTVVVPAAGLGTRFLPATKTVPKELLPVVDTPGIELIAAEAAELGATRLAIITAPNKAGVLARVRPPDGGHGGFDQEADLRIAGPRSSNTTGARYLHQECRRTVL